MRISKKGQVTIPAHLRKALGFLPHTEVEFIKEGSNLIIRKVTSHPNNNNKTKSR